MAHGAKIEVRNYLSYAHGSYIRRKTHPDQVFILMERDKRIATSEKGYILDHCKGQNACMPLDGSGTPVNFTDDQIESFKGVITITV